MGMCCEECAHFAYGECHAAPPAARDYAFAIFPKVRPTDCCGHFQRREEKKAKPVIRGKAKKNELA